MLEVELSTSNPQLPEVEFHLPTPNFQHPEVRSWKLECEIVARRLWRGTPFLGKKTREKLAPPRGDVGFSAAPQNGPSAGARERRVSATIEKAVAGSEKENADFRSPPQDIRLSGG